MFLCKEKMCPVIGIVKYDSFEDAVAIAKANLDVEGRGHSVAVHSNDDEHLKYIGQKTACKQSAGKPDLRDDEWRQL